MTPRQGNRLPKTFSDALARKLNGACKDGEGCSLECAGIGWCGHCWDSAAAKARHGAPDDAPGNTV